MQPDPFRPFVDLPTVKASNDFPLTRFICDLMKHGKEQVRTNWKAGQYPINPAHAAYYAGDVR